jgi:hypothetical protein
MIVLTLGDGSLLTICSRNGNDRDLAAQDRRGSVRTGVQKAAG